MLDKVFRQHANLSSFVAAFPMSDPRYIVLIMVLSAFNAMVAPDFDPVYFATITLSLVAGALTGGVSIGHLGGKTQ